MLRRWVWFTSCSSFGYLSAQLAVTQDRARVLTSIGVQATFSGNEQNDESVTGKKADEGDLFHVVLETMDVTDGYQYLQV